LVDFKKRLTGKTAENPTDPVKLYGTLDRAHDKGPLRPAQEAVLSDWFADHQSTRDVIVKLHTGQGKTLIGLLMLQSRLNAGKGSVIYLCPDHFLIDQAREQARLFGIKTCTAENDLPEEFADGGSILVTSVQKLFNGLTKFGLHRQSVNVDSVLMDDAHACADRIREACRIRIPSDEAAYVTLRTLFAPDLEQQGAGTFADILNGTRESLLPVPYWAWLDHQSDVATILSSNADRRSIKFAWPLLKDDLAYCRCVISGAAIEIEPYIAPLGAFGTYSKAKHRVFMSATVTDDAFLVKGLQLKPETIANPLTYSKETWSGEKMVLLPSLIHEDLDRERVVNGLAKPNAKRTSGVVALAPSFARTADWKALGATVVDKDTVWEAIAALKSGKFENTLVLVNRYDGIDLPDETCRILVFDSMPYSESLIDLYQERCRPNSDATLSRTIRSIEQGMGRSVRGEKDYCVIISIGTELVRLLREKTSRQHLSPQMAAQIQIGLEIAEFARQEIEEGKTPLDAFNGLIRQSRVRDPDWKAYYVEHMDKISPRGANVAVLNIFAAELDAERLYIEGDYAGASELVQTLLDGKSIAADDKGWYLQERARYLYLSARTESQALQVAGHKMNHLLLKPPTGVTVAKLTVVSHGRAERIAEWVRNRGSYTELNATISAILGSLVFGTNANAFEYALDELSRALGFAGERPDAEWKEGPDNLWALDDRQYLIFECKSEVDITRAHINKRETEQMNRSCAWFDKHYPGMTVRRFIVHPAGKIESAASFTHDVEGIREHNLRKLVRACREFFKSFESHDLKSLSSVVIQKLVDAHHLAVDDLATRYSSKLKDLK
jgi:replicative superfamily II helicase